MEMNAYDLDRVLASFQDHGLTRVQVSLSRMGPIRSATVVGVREGQAPRR